MKKKSDKSNKKKSLHMCTLNITDLYKNYYKKSSDSDVYFTKIKNLDNILKKNKRSGSFMNMANYNVFNKLETFDSSDITIINNNIIINNIFFKEKNIIKGNENLKISAKPLFHLIIPNRKFSNETRGNKISKIIGNINTFNLNINKKIIIQSIKSQKMK